MEYTVYILRCADDSLYTGIALSVQDRVQMHAAGTGSKYVRARLPVQLVYTETCDNRSAATKREMEIKKMSRTKKIMLLHNSERNIE